MHVRSPVKATCKQHTGSGHKQQRPFAKGKIHDTKTSSLHTQHNTDHHQQADSPQNRTCHQKDHRHHRAFEPQQGQQTETADNQGTGEYMQSRTISLHSGFHLIVQGYTALLSPEKVNIFSLGIYDMPAAVFKQLKVGFLFILLQLLHIVAEDAVDRLLLLQDVAHTAKFLKHPAFLCILMQHFHILTIGKGKTTAHHAFSILHIRFPPIFAIRPPPCVFVGQPHAAAPVCRYR